MRLLRIMLVTSVMAWSTPAWGTPITVTFSGTVTSAAPLWSYWLPGFGVGVEIDGYVTGDTDPLVNALAPVFWTFNVAGHTGTANTSGPAFLSPTGVFIGANWNASISGATEFVASYIAEMVLNPQNQTGYIAYSGIGRDPNGVTQWDQTWEANITSITVNVPEPSTLGLFGFGLLAVIGCFRRQGSNRRPLLSTD